MDGLEEVGDAEVVNEVGDALVGVEEFDEGRAGAGGGSLEADAGEDAEKGAVHELAVGEVEDDAGGAAFLEAGMSFLKSTLVAKLARPEILTMAVWSWRQMESWAAGTVFIQWFTYRSCGARSQVAAEDGTGVSARMIWTRVCWSRRRRQGC